jgi:Leucine-rich repeat (LRR) protein
VWSNALCRRHRNQVTEFPIELSKLPALTQLKAHHNHIAGFPKWFVHACTTRWLACGVSDRVCDDRFKEMTGLQTLDLAHNRLRSLPAEIGTCAHFPLCHLAINDQRAHTCAHMQVC